MKKFMVDILKDNGETENQPMKEWLRNHPNAIPSGIEPSTNTSHEIRNALKKQGWKEEHTDTEIILKPPKIMGLVNLQMPGKKPKEKASPKWQSQVVGNIGLYYACYQLSRLGWNIMPTARNARGVDIIGYSQDYSRFISIQVKALSKRSPVPLGQTLDNIKGDFWVIVNNLSNTPAVFVMLPEEIKGLAHKGEKDSRISYWLQPNSYTNPDFSEAWTRIGRGD